MPDRNKKYGFKNGIHPVARVGASFLRRGGDKALTSSLPLKKIDPELVYILMGQGLGPPCAPEVKEGDRVLAGRRVGAPAGDMGVPVHASVSGRVVAVKEVPTVSRQNSLAVVIENDREYKTADVSSIDLESTESGAIAGIMRDAGLVGMGGAGFPTHIKYSAKKSLVEHLLINAAECETFLTCDHRLMLESAGNIVLGILAMAKAINAQHIFFCIEDNKPDAAAVMQSAFAGTPIKLKLLKTKYPQGGERQLIKAVTGQEVQSGRLPVDSSVIVSNVATAAALGDAFATGLPLIKRIVTVSGEVKSPGNFLAPIGTPYADLLRECGAGDGEDMLILSGGAMTGTVALTGEIPVTKCTSGITALRYSRGRVLNCIHCGGCAGACPAGLMPFKIEQAQLRGRMDIANEYHARECIGCGCCSYVCPSKRMLAQNIEAAKAALAAAGRREAANE